MSNGLHPQIGQIVRYTDPDGHHHDAIVDAVVNDRVSIRTWPPKRLTPIALWVSPTRLNIPR